MNCSIYSNVDGMRHLLHFRLIIPVFMHVPNDVHQPLIVSLQWLPYALIKMSDACGRRTNK